MWKHWDSEGVRNIPFILNICSSKISKKVICSSKAIGSLGKDRSNHFDGVWLCWVDWHLCGVQSFLNRRNVINISLINLLGASMIDFMDEKLFTNINKLPVNNPCIELMVKHLMAAKQDPWKHVFNNWVATCALLVKRIQDFSSSLALLFYLKHEVKKSWEHLKVNSKFLLKGQDSQRSIF